MQGSASTLSQDESELACNVVSSIATKAQILKTVSAINKMTLKIKNATVPFSLSATIHSALNGTRKRSRHFDDGKLSPSSVKGVRRVSSSECTRSEAFKTAVYSNKQKASRETKGHPEMASIDFSTWYFSRTATANFIGRHSTANRSGEGGSEKVLLPYLSCRACSKAPCLLFCWL